MKAFYALGAIVLVVHSTIASATLHSDKFYPLPCEGTVVLDSQADVDAFGANYPCSEFDGNIKVSGADITNLNGLSSLTRINGRTHHRLQSNAPKS